MCDGCVSELFYLSTESDPPYPRCSSSIPCQLEDCMRACTISNLKGVSILYHWPQTPFKTIHSKSWHNRLVVCDESGHTQFPFSFAILSWGALGWAVSDLPEQDPGLILGPIAVSGQHGLTVLKPGLLPFRQLSVDAAVPCVYSCHPCTERRRLDKTATKHCRWGKFTGRNWRLPSASIYQWLIYGVGNCDQGTVAHGILSNEG